MDWPAVVAFPAHPTVPGLECNENHSIENKSRRKKGEGDMPEDWNKKKELKKRLSFRVHNAAFNYKCLAGKKCEV